MNQLEMVELLAAHHDMSKAKTTAILRDFFAIIQQELIDGEKVSFTGFGQFEAPLAASRVGLNIQTRENVVIPAVRRVKFRAGKKLREALKAASDPQPSHEKNNRSY